MEVKQGETDLGRDKSIGFYGYDARERQDCWCSVKVM